MRAKPGDRPVGAQRGSAAAREKLRSLRSGHLRIKRTFRAAARCASCPESRRVNALGCALSEAMRGSPRVDAPSALSLGWRAPHGQALRVLPAAGDGHLRHGRRANVVCEARACGSVFLARPPIPASWSRYPVITRWRRRKLARLLSRAARRRVPRLLLSL